MTLADTSDGTITDTLTGRLHRLREGPYSEAAVAMTFLIGVLATAVHWGGLVVGGVLIGVLASSTSRAFVLGLYFGTVVLLAYAALLGWYGVLGAAAGATPLSLATVAIGLAVPTATAVVARLLTPGTEQTERPRSAPTE